MLSITKLVDEIQEVLWEKIQTEKRQFALKGIFGGLKFRCKETKPKSRQ